MSQPAHISEVLLKVAADPTDPFSKVLRQCPFIQAELIHRKLMSLDDLTDELVICASAPQSNDISRAYSKAAEFIAPQTPVTTAIALKTAYDGKYDAPSAGAPKVFVKYFYVNTATGEKSGEMLGVATLSSSEEDGD